MTIKQNNNSAYIEPSELSHFRDKTDELLDNLENNDFDAALKCINEINEINSKSFYDVIGKLTRGLHMAISDLNISSADSASDNDRIRVDLNYVIDVTNDAAGKTLDMTEKSMGTIKELKESQTNQQELLENYLATHSPDEELQQLLVSLTENAKNTQELGNNISSNISEIVIAQNFQDLASQSITKAIGIIRGVESSLITLTQYTTLLRKLSRYSDSEILELDEQEGKNIKTEIDQINSIGESEHLDQGDVDNLLSSLGF